MGDDEMPEMSVEEKLEIANNFVFNSPPGQTQKVVEDVRTLVGESALSKGALESIVHRVNKDKFLSVTVPNAGYDVLLTPFGELEEGRFLDPNEKQQLVIDHVNQTCTGTKPLGPGQSSLCAAETLRKSVDDAMKAHAEKFLPGATVTTYGREEGGNSQVTCCVGKCNMNLSNFWSGLWRSQWTLVAAPNGRSGQLSGSVSCNVHYFEDGNVQLNDSTKFQKTISLQGDIGPSVAAAVAEFEQGFLTGMEEIYQTMSESVLNALRRRLPITKVKFDWDNKASVHKLASELNAAKLS